MLELPLCDGDLRPRCLGGCLAPREHTVLVLAVTVGKLSGKVDFLPLVANFSNTDPTVASRERGLSIE